MSKASQGKEFAEIAALGTALGTEGVEVKKGLWETGVYLGKDGFVYHIVVEQGRGGLRISVAGKRSVGWTSVAPFGP